MRRVRREGTAPELQVRKAAHALGLRFRLHRKDLPGSPDLVFPGRHVVIFVHGCFWHGHEGCRYGTVPKTRTAWWQAKIAANRARDQLALSRLEGLGWRPAVVWECLTRDAASLRTALAELFGTRVDACLQVEEESESEDRSTP